VRTKFDGRCLPPERARTAANSDPTVRRRAGVAVAEDEWGNRSVELGQRDTAILRYSHATEENL